jgi:cell division protein FtsB
MKDITGTAKKFSIFNILISLIITAFITALYINNIIKVNQLASGNNEMKKTLSELSNSNDVMRTEIEKLITFEKINSYAGEKLNMKYLDSSVEKESIIIKKSELQ